MKKNDMQELLKNRLRVGIIWGNSPLVTMPVIAAGPVYKCVVSAYWFDTDREIKSVDASDLNLLHIRKDKHSLIAPPLVFSPGGGAFGYTWAIAEAVLLLAHYNLDASFSYTKKDGSVGERRIKCTYADGGHLWGNDYDRDMAKRSFLINRIKWIKLSTNAIHKPQWVESEYRSVLA